MSFYQRPFADLLITTNKHLLTITLNRPEQSNAISLPMIDSLKQVLSYADTDNEIRVIILTGAGKSFCAGGDVKAMEEQSGMFAGESNELRNRYIQGIQEIPRSIEALQTPIIAMVNGPAIGAGCDLSVMCDLRVAGKSAKFAETFSKLSLVPGDGGTFFLQRVVGYSKAMEMFLTGDSYNGEQALAMGLINKLCDDNNLENETFELATKISQNGPIAQAMTKQALKAYKFSDLSSQLNMLATFQGIAQRTHDHQEGLAALKERRSPQFKGN